MGFKNLHSTKLKEKGKKKKRKNEKKAYLCMLEYFGEPWTCPVVGEFE